MFTVWIFRPFTLRLIWNLHVSPSEEAEHRIKKKGKQQLDKQALMGDEPSFSLLLLLRFSRLTVSFLNTDFFFLQSW